MQALACPGGLDLSMRFGSMKVVYIAILGSLVLFQGLKGGVVPQGGEYPLVSDVSGHQSAPDLILWREGGLLAWENTTGKGIKRIIVQSINSEGRATGDAQVINVLFWSGARAEGGRLRYTWRSSTGMGRGLAKYKR